MPPMFRAVPFRDENAFFDEIAGLRARLDADRAQAKPAETRQ
jgi:hypothetical protein